MLTGFMDHWVPSDDAVSRFWKTPFENLRPLMERLCDEQDFNNFTFYTKWYTNGIKSALPFLRNHPENMNVKTDNDWGRQWIEFFHRRGMTVGAMLQCYVLEQGVLPSEAALGRWSGLAKVTGQEHDAEIVNPEWDGYDAMLEEMLIEHLRLFPGLDAIFLEFEGLCAVPGAAAAARLPGLAAPGANDAAPEIAARWEESGFDVMKSEQWTWGRAAQKILSMALSRHLAIAERALDRCGFRGIRGIVYHAMGYETPYIMNCLPGRNWWLLPWHYWGWDNQLNTGEALVRRQMDFCKREFAAAIDKGHKLCYIGNGTLPTVRLDEIVEMARFCQEKGAAGYLAMGDPLPRYGLRWHGATEESVTAVRKLYRERIFGR